MLYFACDIVFENCSLFGCMLDNMLDYVFARQVGIPEVRPHKDYCSIVKLCAHGEFKDLACSYCDVIPDGID